MTPHTYNKGHSWLQSIYDIKHKYLCTSLRVNMNPMNASVILLWPWNGKQEVHKLWMLRGLFSRRGEYHLCLFFLAVADEMFEKASTTCCILLESSHRLPAPGAVQWGCLCLGFGWMVQSTTLTDSGFDFCQCVEKHACLSARLPSFLPSFWPNRHGFHRCLLSCCRYSSWVSSLM